MKGLIEANEELIYRLPLPLAQLVRRAVNAKTPLERHQAAFYLWESSLKLLGATAVVEYVELEDGDPELRNRLQVLARPSLGHWWELVRRLIPILAESGHERFGAIRDLVLGRTRDDLPRSAGLDSALREALNKEPGARSAVRLTELIDRLVHYRNREIGHGAAGQRSTEFYDRMGHALLLGVSELLGRIDVLAGRQLVFIEDVRQVSGKWLVERYELRSECARRIESVDLPIDGKPSRIPRAGQVYLTPDPASMDGSRSLHPLLLFDLESGSAFYLASRRGKHRSEYLCYTTGQVLDREDLGEDHRRFLERALGRTIEPASVEEWAAQSMAEDAPEPAATAETDQTLRRIGDFELLSKLGQGGMGAVYRAWQPSLGRQVALKCLIRAGDPKAEARFGREIRALGRVEHPNLVRVFGSGSAGDQWYYAMELVEGVDLGSVCAKLRGGKTTQIGESEWQTAISSAVEEARSREVPVTPEPDREAARTSPSIEMQDHETPAILSKHHCRPVVDIIYQVALAAHTLHESGVIHRDIKPGNVMLTPDGRHAVLMDLGLAQLLDDTEGRLTRTRQFVGTLRYASPEQVLAVEKVDRRSDVYSLGASLWELLTLRPLFGATDETPTPELMKKIMTEDPERPSRSNPAVPGDLDAIVLKCLEKKPERRYQSAAELAIDLDRWRREAPVLAQPLTLKYVLGKFVSRNRRRITAVAALLLFVAIAITLAVYRSKHLRERKLRGHLLQGEMLLTTGNHQEALAEAGKALGVDASSTAALRLKSRIDQALLDAKERQITEASGRRLAAESLSVLATDPTLALLLAIEAAKRWPGPHANRALAGALQDCREIRTLWHLDKVMDADFSCDGRFVVAAVLARDGEDDHARVWNLETGKTVTTIHHRGLKVARFNPDARRVITAGGDKSARIWDAKTGKELVVLKHREDVVDAAFTHEGSRVLTLTDYGTPRLWDAESGDELLRLQDSTVLWALSPDGTRLVTDSSLWDLKKQMKLAQLPKRVSLSSTLTFNRDGDRIFAEGTYVLNGWTAALMATHDRPANAISIDGYAVQSVSGESGERFTLWDMNSGRIIRDLPFVSRSGWTGAVFSQDGTILFVLGNLKGSVVEPKTGDELLSIRGVWWHDDPVLSPRGTMVAAKTYRKVLRIFAIAPRTEQIREPEPIGCAMFTPEGRRVITASGDKIRIRDIRTLGELLTCKGHRGRVTSVDVSPDGSRIVSASRDTAYVWDATTGAMLAKLNHDGAVWSAKFSPGGRRIVTARTHLWDAVTGTRIRSLEGQSVKFSPDGNSVLTLARSTARIWDVESGEALHELRTPLGAQMADFSPDGTRVLFAGVSSVEVWRLRSDRPEEEIRLKHNLLESNFDQALFSPDGRKVIAADNWNTTCFLWDAQSGEVLHRMRHAGHIIRIAFSPDGKLVMTTSTDDTVRVWEVATGSELFRFRGWHGCFSPDGRKVLAYGHGEKTARIWPLNLLPMALKRRPRYLTQRERNEFHAWGPAERGMQRLVERLFEEHVVQTEVIARIEADTALSEEERGLGLQMAFEHPPTTPYHLNQAAWAVAKKPGRASEDYQLALRRIETARKSVPDSYHYLNTLGVVQYRLSLYEHAVKSLVHAESLRAKRGMGVVPEEVAFLAMSYHRLGQIEKASSEMDRLRKLMQETSYGSRQEALGFLREAEQLSRKR